MSSGSRMDGWNNLEDDLAAVADDLVLTLSRFDTTVGKVTPSVTEETVEFRDELSRGLGADVDPSARTSRSPDFSEMGHRTPHSTGR